MSVRLAGDGVIVLEGSCGSEDAEMLLQQCLEHPGATVDWRSCDAAHAAVVQVLMASGAPLQGPPRGGFLREVVEPALKTR